MKNKLSTSKLAAKQNSTHYSTQISYIKADKINNFPCPRLMFSFELNLLFIVLKQ